MNMPLLDINYYQFTKQLSRYPLNVMLETSAVCNIKCPMCPRTTDNRKKRKDGILTPDNYEKIMEQLKPHIMTLHYSGEPMLNENLPLMCFLAKNKYEIPYTKINTNGTLMKEDNKKKYTAMAVTKRKDGSKCETIVDTKNVVEAMLRSGLDLITFSIECNEEIQKKLRIGSSYKKVKENIIYTSRVLNALRKRGMTNTEICIQHLKGDDVTPIMLADSKRMWEEQYGVPVKIASICTIGDQVGDFGSVREEKANCREVWTNMIINWNGDVTPCCVDHAFQIPFGNILKQPLEKVWTNKKISKLRKQHTMFNKLGTKKGMPKLCKQCLGSK